MSINGSILMGTWAETPKPVTDESRQLEDTLSKMDTIGDKLVKLMESVDPSSVAYLESNSRKRSAKYSNQTTPRRSFRGSPKARADSQSVTDLFAHWKQSEDKGRPTRKSEEAPRGGSDPTNRSPPRRSSDYTDRPRPPVPQRRSSDFRDDRSKGHRRRASDFTTQSSSGEDGLKRRSADSVRESIRKSSGESSRSSDTERRFESLLSSEGELGTARGVTETILEELVSEVSGHSGESDDLPGRKEATVRISHRRRPQSAEDVRMSPAKEMRFAGEEVTSEDGEPKLVRSKTVLEPQVTIQEPPFDLEPGAPGNDAPAPEPSALESGVRRAMRRQMLQQNRAAGLGVGIDERGAKKAILPGTRMHYPPPVEKVNMPRFNMRVATPEGVLSRRQSQWYRRSTQVHAAAEEESAAADLEIARQRAEFKQELERLSAELSEEFSDGAPARPRSHLRERLNGLLSDGDEDELGFKRDFASVDLVALREKFSKAAEPRKGKSHKAFLKRMMHKARLPDRRKAGAENKLLGQLEIPGLNSVLNNAVSPQPATRRKPLYEKKSELKGYSVITEKEQKRMLELLQDVRSKPRPRKAGSRTTSPEVARPAY